MNTVAVIDYGMGNLRSVVKAIEHVAPRAKVLLTSNAAEISSATRVVFPGQGAIAGCMAALDSCHLRDAVFEAVQTKPFLGICLGLQALFEFSEEGGGVKGLGILPGRVPRFPPERMNDPKTDQVLKVPHMGWNQVRQAKPHTLWNGIPDNARFYFVHSYYADAAERGHVAGETDYGLRFTSAAARANIFAVQFHPEKSATAGLRLLDNFMNWDGGA
ncbi:MAG: imidazole glycerol phosphate synthase subunit HisH [Gammaproteobacteria bacterium]|nr:imidazole glycerol phosphate synthase subunit HisH [Gammaproteobacteria bacterium]